MYTDSLLQVSNALSVENKGDLYPQGAAMSPTCTTYFIKSKSSLIKVIIILCTKKEKKCYKLNPDTISLSLGNFIF